MSESITSEIDLRPHWRRWGMGEVSIRVRSRTLVIAGSAAGLALVLFALSSGEPSRQAPRIARAKAAVTAAPRKQAQPVDVPRKDEAPIVIHATREADAAPAIDAPAAAKSTLKLTSEPSVWVYEGENRLGRTPVELKLDPGRHDLRYVDKAKDLDQKAAIDVRAGQKLVRDLNFGVGVLRIEAPEGTKAFIGTKSIGAAPFSKIELVEGKHHLRLKRGSEVVDEWIEVPPSRVIDYRVRFADE